MATALLTILLFAFIARVLGQLIVLLFKPRWLPPMKDWYSGLLPYPILLPAQIAIIVLMITMIRKPPTANRQVAVAIFVFATLYALGMIVRFFILRRRHPDYRWYEGGMIPIMFHWVLATFLFTFASQRL